VLGNVKLKTKLPPAAVTVHALGRRVLVD
jgi:hypothetical protein